MAKMYLVQHGMAMTREADPERGLSAKGRAEAERVAAHLRGRGLTVTAVRHSPKLRARQTAEIFADALEVDDVAEAEGMAPEDDPGQLAGRAAQDGIMYVGHLPHLERLAARLVTGDDGRTVVRLRNAGVLCLAVEGGSGSVLWYLTPELC